ncbi:hypothetical protein D3C76_1412440 [compost metagenome]
MGLHITKPPFTLLQILVLSIYLPYLYEIVRTDRTHLREKEMRDVRTQKDQKINPWGSSFGHVHHYNILEFHNTKVYLMDISYIRPKLVE